MAKHAMLSASSSHRWMNCTPSARLELEFENRTSPAAAEGTAAHEMAEYKLSKALNKQTDLPEPKHSNDEMEMYTDDYVAFVFEQLELAKQVCKDPIVLIEQRLDFSKYVREGFGTGDCIIVSDKTMHIIDFKYGMGILVDAKNNSQMMLYSLGALENYISLYDIEEVTMTIFQPRRDSVSTWTIPVSELYGWAENELKAKASLAHSGEGEYCPGDWCTFCKAAVKCRARAEEKLKLAQSEFKLPPLLTDDEIEDALGKIGDITRWANDLLAYATDAAVNHGKEWKGYKVVEGRSIRKFKDEESVAKAATEHGYKDIYKKSLINLTDFERLMGKKQFNEVLGSLVYKPPGKPTLVPTTDKRPAINVSNAQNEFKKIKEDI